MIMRGEGYRQQNDRLEREDRKPLKNTDRERESRKTERKQKLVKITEVNLEIPQVDEE